MAHLRRVGPRACHLRCLTFDTTGVRHQATRLLEETFGLPMPRTRKGTEALSAECKVAYAGLHSSSGFLCRIEMSFDRVRVGSSGVRFLFRQVWIPCSTTSANCGFPVRAELTNSKASSISLKLMATTAFSQ
jgi:hypothetical protein